MGGEGPKEHMQSCAFPLYKLWRELRTQSFCIRVFHVVLKCIDARAMFSGSSTQSALRGLPAGHPCDRAFPSFMRRGQVMPCTAALGT